MKPKGGGEVFLFVRFLFKRTKAQVPIPRDSCYLERLVLPPCMCMFVCINMQLDVCECVCVCVVCCVNARVVWVCGWVSVLCACVCVCVRVCVCASGLACGCACVRLCVIPV
jgi:hypothetical protein